MDAPSLHVVHSGPQKEMKPPRGSRAQSSAKLDSMTHAKLRQRIIEDYLNDDSEEPPQHETLFKSICSMDSSTNRWVDSNQARCCVCCLIVSNAVFMGISFGIPTSETLTRSPSRNETNSNLSMADEASDNFSPNVGVFIAQILFAVLFSIELVLRVWPVGAKFFRDNWNSFDAMCVAVSVIDSCILTFVDIGGNGLYFFTLFRMLRVFRIFQVVRLFRFVRELLFIVRGMWGALATLFWSMCLLLIIVYVFAMMCTMFIGQSEEFRDNEMMESLFGSVGSSMFTLFVFVTLEDWPDAARQIMQGSKTGPLIVLVIIFFILFTNLAILNLVTAVMVDSIMSISRDEERRVVANMEKEKKFTVQRLHNLFNQMGGDDHDKLTLEMFQAAVRDQEEVRIEMGRLEVGAYDVRELFDLIDVNGDGLVSADEFIEGALCMRSGSKQLMGLQYDLHKMWNALGFGQEALAQQARELAASADNARRQAQRKQRDDRSDLVELVAETRRAIDAACADLGGRIEAGIAVSERRILESLACLPELLATAERAPTIQSVAEVKAAVCEEATGLQRALLPLAGLERLALGVERLTGELREGQCELREALAVCEMRLSENLGMNIALPDVIADGNVESHDVASMDVVDSIAVSARQSPLHSAPGPSLDMSLISESPSARDGSVGAVPPCPLVRSSPVAVQKPLESPARTVSGTPVHASGCVTMPLRSLARSPTHVGGEAFHLPPQLRSHEASCTAQMFPGVCRPTHQRTEGHSSGIEMLVGPPDAMGEAAPRVAGVRQWIDMHGWLGVPFDKLVLKLESIGVQLSVREQDLLRQAVFLPGFATLGR